MPAKTDGEIMGNETTKECPFCAERINIRAKKCRFCGELLDPTDRLLEEVHKESRFAQEHLPYIGTRPLKRRSTYILLALFLGLIGIHNFYAGYIGRALAQLFTTLFIAWLAYPLLLGVFIWVLVEICAVEKDGTGMYFM